MDNFGETRATFAYERLKEYPVSGGPSTDRRSLHAPELVEQSVALLRQIAWRGIAMVEWKEDVREKRPKILEINPRFWGSLELAIRAGVDFPSLYARLALGESIGLPPVYSPGVRCRWMIPGEILRYIGQPARRRESVRTFLSGLPGLAEEWDPVDVPGSISTLVCTGALALHPRYWKYVRRG
jgi:predicted ATP-grasp superfamily ATP-dependent carboligase